MGQWYNLGYSMSQIGLTGKLKTVIQVHIHTINYISSFLIVSTDVNGTSTKKDAVTS